MFRALVATCLVLTACDLGRPHRDGPEEQTGTGVIAAREIAATCASSSVTFRGAVFDDLMPAVAPGYVLNDFGSLSISIPESLEMWGDPSMSSGTISGLGSMDLPWSAWSTPPATHTDPDYRIGGTYSRDDGRHPSEEVLAAKRLFEAMTQVAETSTGPDHRRRATAAGRVTCDFWGGRDSETYTCTITGALSASASVNRANCGTR